VTGNAPRHASFFCSTWRCSRLSPHAPQSAMLFRLHTDLTLAKPPRAVYEAVRDMLDRPR